MAALHNLCFGIQPAKRTITPEQWDQRLNQVSVSKEDMNRLVMDFLVTEVRWWPCLVTQPGVRIVMIDPTWQSRGIERRLASSQQGVLHPSTANSTPLTEHQQIHIPCVHIRTYTRYI